MCITGKRPLTVCFLLLHPRQKSSITESHTSIIFFSFLHKLSKVFEHRFCLYGNRVRSTKTKVEKYNGCHLRIHVLHQTVVQLHLSFNIIFSMSMHWFMVECNNLHLHSKWYAIIWFMRPTVRAELERSSKREKKTNANDSNRPFINSINISTICRCDLHTFLIDKTSFFIINIQLVDAAVPTHTLVHWSMIQWEDLTESYNTLID